MSGLTAQMTSHYMDVLSSKYNVKRFPRGHPKHAAYIEELKRAILDHGPRPKFYAVQLAVDMKKRNGVSERDLVKEEAIRLLKSICGSSWEDKFIWVAVGHVFFCELFEDEANILYGKEEVVSVQLAPLNGRGVACPLSDAPASKTAAEPSSIPAPEQVKQKARITFHKKDGDIYVCGGKRRLSVFSLLLVMVVVWTLLFLMLPAVITTTPSLTHVLPTHFTKIM